MLDGELSIHCGDAFAAAAAVSPSCPAGAPTGSGPLTSPPGQLLIAVPGGIVDYFHQINTASPTTSTTGSVSATASARSRYEQRTCARPWLAPAQNDLLGA
jgi:hypothetical protein